jgi:plastocyanin
VLRALVHDRRRVIPLLAVLITVGASLVAILSSGSGSGSIPAVAAPAKPTPRRASAIVTVSPRRPAKTVRVSIRRFLFHARTVTIERGTRIRWTNEDRTEHTATEEGKFDTDVLRTGAAKTITFRQAGTYDYICALHPFMRGRVRVR